MPQAAAAGLPPDAHEQEFNPYDLRPLASLNKRRFIDLPGIDPEWVGKIGWEYTGKPVLVDMIRPHVRELGFEESDPNAYPERLSALLSAGESPARDLAATIAMEQGRRLGYQIASIQLSTDGLTEPMVRWEQDYLRHWREHVQTIVLGGGRANGQLGEIVCSAAQEALDRCGLPDLALEVSKHPSYLPLIGLARSVPDGTQGTVVVADFGSSRAKRGLASYEEGCLHSLRVLPTVEIAPWKIREQPVQFAAQMVEILAETVGEAGPGTRLAPGVLCSVAAYVENGEPVRLDGGGYTSLHRVDPDVREWFSRQLSEATERAMRVVFYHDCCAAARALAGRTQTAVLMIGTALGIGFVPPAEGCVPLSGAFTISSPTGHGRAVLVNRSR